MPNGTEWLMLWRTIQIKTPRKSSWYPEVVKSLLRRLYYRYLWLITVLLSFLWSVAFSHDFAFRFIVLLDTFCNDNPNIFLYDMWDTLVTYSSSCFALMVYAWMHFWIPPYSNLLLWYYVVIHTIHNHIIYLSSSVWFLLCLLITDYKLKL